MGSNSLGLGFNPTLPNDEQSRASREDIDCQCIVQLGMFTAGKSQSFDETVTIRHETLPPIFNLALEAEELPDWLAELTVTPTGAILPPLPGLGIAGFEPSDNEVLVQAPYLLPLAPLVFVGNGEPGGFAHFSMPSTMYGLRIQGTFSPEATSGLKTFKTYVTGSYSPGGQPRVRVGRIVLAALLQDNTVYGAAAAIPDELKPPVFDIESVPVDPDAEPVEAYVYPTNDEAMASAEPEFIPQDKVQVLDYDPDADFYELESPASELEKVIVLQLTSSELVATSLTGNNVFWLPNPASEPVVPHVVNEAGSFYDDFESLSIEQVTIDSVAGYVVTVTWPQTPAPDPEPAYVLPEEGELVFVYFEAYGPWEGAALTDAGALDVSDCNRSIMLDDELKVLYAVNIKSLFNPQSV